MRTALPTLRCRQRKLRSRPAVGTALAIGRRDRGKLRPPLAKPLVIGAKQVQLAALPVIGAKQVQLAVKLPRTTRAERLTRAAESH